MNQHSFFYAIEPLVRRLPAVERPEGHVHFKKKLSWTVGILILYFALSNVSLFGLSPASIDLFGMYRAFFAGSFGSIMLLGIGPIVTASIVLQLLVGADIIKLNLRDPRDQAIFQGTQKLLVFVMIIVEALPQVMGGYLLPDQGLASALGVSLGVISFLIFVQICIGGVLILFMDEVVSKWGIGSGVGLFIVAGVSQSLITGLFNWTIGDKGLPIGIIPKWIFIFTNDVLGLEDVFTTSGLERIFIDGGLLALMSTIAIILFVVLVESTRVEIPLAHSAVRGARGRFPVKLVYASVLPMILVRALQANIQMMGTLLAGKIGTVTTASTTDTAAGLNIVYTAYSSIIGTFTSTSQYDMVTGELVGATSPQPISGLMYYLSPINNGPIDWVPGLVSSSNPGMELLGLSPIASWQIWLHVFTDAFVLVVGGVIFAIFWIETTGMGAKSVAAKIHASGLQVPGHRRNAVSIEKLLGRYIPKVTVIGGVIIGLLTLIAGLMGTLGGAGGTGLLLAVSITYRLYEQIASEQIQEMYPMMRKFFGESA
ncbi:MAG: preprotein translocase subunit SecY [Methanothrix sp.]|jgi:preprotein translocase subunit SecY|uniref:Protein translocase subunit SecY n=1 Tax=Methanothrix harundinacea TaxID=301375 RepID=A0A124FMJ2_9EURY|nr:MAG: Protein translocase subunit SecY [Methanothrix harundinacea]MDD2637803.1 preprotein translocase subunit SecY [Methanothrix sp.]MDI9399961.1 preprotein translocase subunit SecY [Euryarchaeota archaeon]KUK95143.1 MAG: Protein translocase subunit SecY [Methanothrix harundinacea]MCP1391339.1 preprotein translocase subunit SecY [Methanothrix harundinacea]